MVDISSGDKKINITVSTSGNKASVNATPDTAMYYSNKSREWAISDKIVSNEDYSSKYYANVSKQNAEIVKDKVTEVNNAVAEGITNIINQENISVDNVNTAGETQVNLAKEQAAIATTQAGIATAKTSEVVESGNAAITAITEQETTSKNNIETKGAEQIDLIQNEGATQIANVQSTGFYMIDDKLYFINSQGEETEFKSGGSGLEVCDIGTALFVDETKGLRRYLNGQIVDINTNTQAFLNRLLQIQTTNPDYFTTEDSWQAEATLNIDGYVYKFVLNYADDGETIVSVRLPKYPDYVEINAGGTLSVYGNGMNLGITNGAEFGAFIDTGNDNRIGVQSEMYGKPVGTTPVSGLLTASKSYGVTTDPTKSGIQTTLKQTKLKMRYFIQIATGAETENNIINTLENVNGFTLLESKYSDKPLYNEGWLLSNGQYNAKAVYPTVYECLQVEYNSEIEAGTTVTLPGGTKYTKRGLSVKLNTEDYTDYDFVLNTADETFRLQLKTILSSDSTLYLYFYVGNVSQNNGIIDAGRIGETLATKTDKVQAAQASMPSGRYVNLTLGASGSTTYYTAPANGYFTIVGKITYMTLSCCKIGKIFESNYTSYKGDFIPCLKGQRLEVYYSGTTSIDVFRFVYAEGESSD